MPPFDPCSSLVANELPPWGPVLEIGVGASFEVVAVDEAEIDDRESEVDVMELLWMVDGV